MKVTVCRKAFFNATHRLHNPRWSQEKNERVFGVCNSKNYHGHNYELIVKLTGEVDPETGLVMDLRDLSEIIDKHVKSRYDHKNLFEDVEDFRTINPSTENMAIKIWEILREKISEKYDIHITLYETMKNFVEYSGPDHGNQ